MWFFAYPVGLRWVFKNMVNSAVHLFPTRLSPLSLEGTFIQGQNEHAQAPWPKPSLGMRFTFRDLSDTWTDTQCIKWNEIHELSLTTVCPLSRVGSTTDVNLPDCAFELLFFVLMTYRVNCIIRRYIIHHSVFLLNCWASSPQSTCNWLNILQICLWLNLNMHPYYLNLIQSAL